MKHKLPLFLCSLILIMGILSISPVHAYSTSYLYPQDDAKVWKYSSSTNYGNDPISSFGNMSRILANDEAIGYWKFNLSDFDPTLESGEEIQYTGFYFDLYVHNYYDWNDGDNFFTLAYSYNETWLEDQITWLDKPIYTETNEDVNVIIEDSYVSWDLREIENDLINGIQNRDNFTLVITYNGFETQGFSARMREYGGVTTDPRITILYEITSPLDYEYEREINLAQFPYALGEALRIGDLGGQLLASMIMILLFMLPTMYCCRKWNNPIPYLIVGIPLLSFLVAINFLPVWTLVLLVMIIAFLYASHMRGWLRGRD